MRRLPLVLLMLLLTATPSINLAWPSLQKEYSIQSTAKVLIQQDSEGIFFKYGAESGVLHPPWTLLWTLPTVSDEHARTGSKSIKCETIGGSKTFPENIAGVRYDVTMTELYLSWWVYLPSNYYTNMLSVKDTIGGLKYMWANWTRAWGMRFMILPSSLYFGLGASAMPASLKDATFTARPPAGQWNHFQIYWKESMTGHGVVRAWVNNDLRYERVGSGDFYTDPQYWDATAPDAPYVTLTRYVDYGDPAGYIYIDDVVVAAEKVPENIGVVVSG